MFTSPRWVRPRLVSTSLLSRARPVTLLLLQTGPSFSVQSHPKGLSPGLGKHGEAAQPLAGGRTHDIVGKFGPLGTGGRWGEMLEMALYWRLLTAADLGTPTSLGLFLGMVVTEIPTEECHSL